MSTNAKTASSNANVNQWDQIPGVQYGFSGEDRPAREPKLRTIFEPIPEEAITASPIYSLTADQYERQENLDNPYRVSGGYTMLATELQDECEDDDRVLYPVHIESDEYHQEGSETLKEWFRMFVEDCLGVSFANCSLYFSGRRSIHVHVPRFVSGERQRELLKQRAETFCEETGAKLDCGLYYAKRLFRLPGVQHEKTGLSKVKIQPSWDHDRIIQEAAGELTGRPQTYEEVLRDVFLRESLVEGSIDQDSYAPEEFFRVLDSDKSVLDMGRRAPDIETPLIERGDYPDEPATRRIWAQYNAKEFSPYALADGNKRSVAVLNVKGTPFARRDVTVGNTGRPAHALIPAYFEGARGCAGEEFIKEETFSPLQLSKPDFAKWIDRGFEQDEYIVIIGGKSRNSIILSIRPHEAKIAGNELRGDEGSREAALSYLRSLGYDTGEATGSNAPKESLKRGRQEGPNSPPSTDEPATRAAELQRRAEQEGIETLSHDERWRVACRLLKGGWEPAWEWFQAQYGTSFKPKLTWEQLKSAVQANPDDYTHVDIPQRPT